MNVEHPYSHNIDVLFIPPPLGMVENDHPGLYGIEYDLYTRILEDELPAGWNAHRQTIYNRIVRTLRLRGFNHPQYSVWNRLGSATFVWYAMMSLREIAPRGIIPTSTRGCQMHEVSMNAWIVTDEIRLGGVYAPFLLGPTPAGLIPVGVPNEPVPVPPAWVLPVGQRSTPSANNVANWRRHPV